jgi:hypothetical protein
MNALEIAFYEHGSVVGRLSRSQTVLPEPHTDLMLDYGCYQQLCSLMSSPAMKLRHLTIAVETYVACHREYNVHVPFKVDSIKTSLLHEEVFPLGTPAWLDSLLAIEGLESISVWWSMTSGFLKRTARSLVKIRTGMLRNKLSTLEATDVTIRPSIQFFARVVSNDNLSLNGYVGGHVDAALTYNLHTDELQWRDCTLRLDIARFIEVVEEENGAGTALADGLTCVPPAILPTWGHLGTTVYCELRRV